MVGGRCRAKGYMGQVVSVHCQGASYEFPTGFSRQMKIADPTHLTDEIYSAASRLLRQHWDGLPIRRIGVSLSDLVNDQEYQLTLFENRQKKMNLERATDSIKRKYGDAAIMRAISLTAAGQAKDRSQKIGGHYK